MELIWIILGALLIFIGIAGALLPVMPGLPFSYLGLIILQIVHQPFSVLFMLVWAIIVVVVSFVLDNAIPAWSTKKFGGSPYGVTGSIVGLIAGLFFPPLGFIVGPLAGAFVGEMIAGNKSDRALKSAFGAFVGFLFATGLKVMAAGMMAWYYFSNI
ncbi:DUF456 domain-containing protein [Gracilimonas mengyeensis]|uniref:DUF456 domain-containing protein n=1 Tax=Gracilimonas mengyeensis TaxID=1302730 RepID=A0A521FAW2_9BACT|nr:DUF456 domain-containing protein [Gracilimonas mengyeensis]SMO93315.1 hypothetical protein SAMN06265219_11682 [Gracilimonas mengyeensis]